MFIRALPFIWARLPLFWWGYFWQYFWSFTISTGAVHVFAICVLTVPSIQSMMPLVPRLPMTMRSDSLALDASVMVFAGFPSMTMGTVLSVGCFSLSFLLVLLSICL